MPDDKYNGLYIHKELVKGSWYGICSGPKPQVYTGNIDTASNLEDIRNKALYIVSPSSENGTFPVYGHKSAVLTTRYGSNVYLQRLFDIDAGVEWERAKIGSTSWYAWKRVTTEGDASSTANAADQRSRDNSTAINQIDKAIGGRTADPSITSRVSSNASNISKLNKDYKSADTALGNRCTTLEGHIGRIRNFEDPNQWSANHRFGTNINIYMGNHVVDIQPGNDSVLMFGPEWASARGCSPWNCSMLVTNNNADGTQGHGVHLEGAQYRQGTGWYLTVDGGSIPSGAFGVTIGYVLFVATGNW